MKRGVLLCIIFMVGFFIVAAGSASGKEIDIGKESMKLESKEGKKPASFPHRFHQEIFSCLECHHVDEQVMSVGKCVTCHNNNMDNSKLNSFKKATHSRCRGCHKSVNKDEGKDAPVRCSGCHPRPE